jgi:flavin reductase (DIM6/NTAB) family NADH-FMN oxidoreductase RutF
MSYAAVHGDQLRRAMGHFATGVAVVSSINAAGQPVGTTANAISSLSLDPPLVLVCFALRSHTLSAVRDHGAFAINVLAAGHREVSASFARPGLAGAIWTQVGHRAGATGSPRLHGALASLECAVEQCIPGGDHEIVVGRVLDIEAEAPDQPPLLFYRGEYTSLEHR